ncbi:class I SAM-dependent methyltransferase [Hoyosella altamirensis]|uniref:SAM-dependent methyltransferase n=1 Tax=Hoyosella altamirensis TaxID=616997 RepID=A0A839RJD8_9ACTN|nr:class I SAM-dependent methyltransferase [Hoyosella altamirensis]MBB3036517.1 SAM-dependent methyltransferase [Hoyosella altamirensis]
MTANSPDRATSFGQAAAEYDRARPTYPRELLARVLPTAGGSVIDCGAGTGLLTRALIELGHAVTAVDPDPLMLQQLRAESPGLPTFQGTGESMPLPDSTARALLFGQAWHWVDPVAASQEADRVLAPGGVLILIWNIRNEDVEWVRKLTAIIGHSPAEDLILTSEPEVAAPFQLDRLETWDWERPLAPETLRELARSRSPYLTASLEERRRVDEALERLLADDAALRGRATFTMPYRTYAFCYSRRQ